VNPCLRRYHYCSDLYCRLRGCAPQIGQHSHGTNAGAADCVRVGLRRQAHQRRDAPAFYGLPAAACGSGSQAEVGRDNPIGADGPLVRAALRLAVPREASRVADAEALRSLPARSEGFCGRRVLVGWTGRGFCGWHCRTKLTAADVQRFRDVGSRLRHLPARARPMARRTSPPSNALAAPEAPAGGLVVPENAPARRGSRFCRFRRR